MAQHKHWPKDHPYYERAPWCDLPTKKACDERWREHRGEAVVFSREDWDALHARRRAEAALYGRRADASYALAYERHVDNVLDGRS